MTAALIEARALGKSFGPTPVLRDVDSLSKPAAAPR